MSGAGAPRLAYQCAQLGQYHRDCSGRDVSRFSRLSNEQPAAPKYLIRDNDRAFSVEFKARVRAMGIRDRPTSYRSPWQNGYVERLIGSIRRECTDHLLVFNVEHLRRILSKYATYYNEVRTHVSLGKTRPAHVRSRGSETLLRIRSLAGYTIDTHESRFRKRQPWGGQPQTEQQSCG